MGFDFFAPLRLGSSENVVQNGCRRRLDEEEETFPPGELLLLLMFSTIVNELRPILRKWRNGECPFG